MPSLHPAIVHFPIALLMSAAIFAVLSLFVKKDSFKEISFWALLAGVLTAVAAILTGMLEERHLVHNQAIHEVLSKHMFNGFAILIFFSLLLTWFWTRKRRIVNKEYAAWVVCLLLGSGLVLYQGFLGGKMVFEQGAGVKPYEPYLEMQGGHKGSHHHDEVDSISHSPADTASKQGKKLKNMKY